MQSSSRQQQKSYRKGSPLYFTAGLVLSMVLVVTAFEWKTPIILHDGPIDFEKTDQEVVFDFQPVSLPAPPKPKPAGPNIEIAPDPLPTEPDVPEPPITTPPDGPVTVLPPDGIPGSGAPADATPEMPDISQAAEPANGYDAFYAYIFERVKVPDHLIRRNMDGKVYVSFVVDKDGRLTDLKIVRGFDKQLEAQILEVLQNAPAWKPAWQQGSPVKQRMVLPIAIKITH